MGTSQALPPLSETDYAQEISTHCTVCMDSQLREILPDRYITPQAVPHDRIRVTGERAEKEGVCTS